MTPDEITKKIMQLLDKGDSNFKDLLENYEKNILIEFKRALREIQILIAKIYEKYGDNVTYADLVIYNRLRNLERSIINEVKKVVNKNIKIIESALKEFYSDGYYRTAHALESSLGVKLGYGMLNPLVIEASLLNPLDRITWSERLKQHSQQFINQIRSELTQGLIQGQGYGTIAKTIREKTELTAGKVLRIVRTEGHRVQNTARVASFKKSEAAAERLGIESARTWVHSGNPREPRKDHIEMNGVEADDEGKFTLPDGTKTEGPGLSGIAEHDINCGCTVSMKIKSFKTISLGEYLKKGLRKK